MKVFGDCLETCVKGIIKMKGYRRFEFGGLWYVAFMAGQGYAYRSKQALKNKALKLKLETLKYVEVGNK